MILFIKVTNYNNLSLREPYFAVFYHSGYQCADTNFCNYFELLDTYSLEFHWHKRKKFVSAKNKDLAYVTIVAGFCPEFHPPFLWRSKHQTKMTVYINNLVPSEFPNRSNRSVRSLISTLICI